MPERGGARDSLALLGIGATEAPKKGGEQGGPQSAPNQPFIASIVIGYILEGNYAERE